MAKENEQVIRVKQITTCGMCREWYRKTWMYKVHMKGIEQISTPYGLQDREIDEDRLICPECYESVGYVSARVSKDDSVEIITDPEYVSRQEQLYLTPKKG